MTIGNVTTVMIEEIRRKMLEEGWHPGKPKSFMERLWEYARDLERRNAALEKQISDMSWSNTQWGI